MTIAWIYLDKRTATVDALKDYNTMEHLIQNFCNGLDEIQSKMTSLSSTSIVKASKNTNPKSGEARLVASISEIDILKERHQRALEYMKWFQPAWDVLTEDERFILSEFYRNEGSKQIDSIATICDRFHIERSSAYNKKNRALDKLALLLYGR